LATRLLQRSLAGGARIYASTNSWIGTLMSRQICRSSVGDDISTGMHWNGGDTAIGGGETACENLVGGLRWTQVSL